MFTDVDQFAVSTDADGRFRTGQVRPGEWFLVASAKGHAPGDHRVKVGTAVPQVEITLGRPRPFKAAWSIPRASRSPGHSSILAPGADTAAWGHSSGPTPMVGSAGTTPPRDDLIVNVSQQGYRALSQQHVAPSGKDVVFTLKPSLRIHGKVHDAETQKRVENATVEVWRRRPGQRASHRSWTGMPELGSSTGVFQGNLDINFPVAADAYKFRVRSPGFQPFVSRTFVGKRRWCSATTSRFVPGTAKPAGAVATVLRPDGKPLAGARLLEIQYGGSVTIQDGVPNVAQGSTAAERIVPAPTGCSRSLNTTSPGAVFILGDDSYAVASKEDAARRHPRSRPSRLRVSRGNTASAAGPCRTGNWSCSGTIGDAEGAYTLYLDQKTTTDPEGRFTFKNVVPASGLRMADRKRPN